MKETTFQNIEGVPDFTLAQFAERRRKYCLLIPVLNENGRLQKELQRARRAKVEQWVDILICDGGSSDGGTRHSVLKALGVRALLTKTGPGKQGAQLRCGIYWALEQGYEGVLTIDGNNKDSIEDVHRFVKKLEQGMDFVQGSRFVKGGLARNTPLSRHLAVRLVHAPVVSLTARHHFTDTTNAFRAYSKRYLTHPDVKPLRDVFTGYELLCYLSTRASQLGLACCEVPVVRVYPKGEPTPTKIKGVRGNYELLRILALNAAGHYEP